MPSVRGMLAQGGKEKGREDPPLSGNARGWGAYFSSFHHLTLGLFVLPTEAEMFGGS